MAPGQPAAAMAPLRGSGAISWPTGRGCRRRRRPAAHRKDYRMACEQLPTGLWRVGGGTWNGAVHAVSAEGDANVYLLHGDGGPKLIDCAPPTWPHAGLHPVHVRAAWHPASGSSCMAPRVGVCGDIAFGKNELGTYSIGLLSNLWQSNLDHYVASLRTLATNPARSPRARPWRRRIRPHIRASRGRSDTRDRRRTGARYGGDPQHRRLTAPELPASGPRRSASGAGSRRNPSSPQNASR